jgi:hypothetical protein
VTIFKGPSSADRIDEDTGKKVPGTKHTDDDRMTA